MSEFIRLQANGVDAYPDASTENTYRSNGTSVESALLALESNVNTLGGVAGEAKTLAEQNSVKIATAEQEISDINSSLNQLGKHEIITRYIEFKPEITIYHENISELNASEIISVDAHIFSNINANEMGYYKPQILAYDATSTSNIDIATLGIRNGTFGVEFSIWYR